jgi:TolA-binding protein
MKLLFVNPRLSSGDPLVRSLQSTGVTVLLANTLEQARQLLTAHAVTLEVVVIHREPSGLELIPFIKSTPSLVDLPYIITSSEWSDADFARHQETSDGANAYLREEKCAGDLRFVIEQVIGCELSMALVAPVPITGSKITGLSLSGEQPMVPEAQIVSGVNVKIEDATSVFQRASVSKPSFTLDVDLEFSRPAGSNSPAEAGAAAVVVAAPESSGPEVEGATRVIGHEELGAPVSVGGTPVEAAPANEVSALEMSTNGGGVSISEILEIPNERLSSPATSVEALPLEMPTETAPSSPATSVEALPLEMPTETAPSSPINFPIDAPSIARAEAPAPVVAESAGDPVSDLPYLFGQAARPRPMAPLGDAVVPGGAAQSPDIETLKRYLALREQDVAALSAQLHEARRRIRQLEEDLGQGHALMEEQGYILEGKEKREQEFEREKALLIEGLQAEMDELRFQMKARSDKARLLESQVRDTAQEMERLRERVRNDIRKIRVREKELENRLEIVKKGSEVLLMAREATILELMRKLDTAEFNLDLMHDRLGREKDASAELREKLLRASQAVRLAGGLLDPADPDAGLPEPSGRSAERPDRKVS